MTRSGIFQQATEADSHNADAFAEFSIMLSVVRRFEESLSYAAHACLLDPISPADHLQAGHANYASGRWESRLFPLPAASAIHTTARICRLGPR
jgi:hypothetical protein